MQRFSSGVPLLFLENSCSLSKGGIEELWWEEEEERKGLEGP
jgi:hypothetical protein